MPPSSILSQANWHIRQTTIPGLYTHESSRPHLVVMGNSIESSTSRYKARVSSPSPRNVHGDAHCSENVHHIQSVLSADHESLALAFFASHRSYSFPLHGGEKGEQFAGDKMDACIIGLRDHWRNLSERLECLGGGHGNLRVFGWQHVFLETMDRLAFGLENWIRRGDLMPLSAEVARHASGD